MSKSGTNGTFLKICVNLRNLRMLSLFHRLHRLSQMGRKGNFSSHLWYKPVRKPGIMKHMFTISRQFTFCYGHRLLHHSGKCAHLHGHNGTVKIELRGDQLNPQGMVADFTDIKNSIGDWIEKTLDHRTILQENDPLVPLLREQGEPILTLPAEPTAENLSKLIYEKTAEFGLPVYAVTFWETEKCSAEYRDDQSRYRKIP